MTGWPGHRDESGNWRDEMRAKLPYRKVDPACRDQITVLPLAAEELIEQTKYSDGNCRPGENAEE